MYVQTGAVLIIAISQRRCGQRTSINYTMRIALLLSLRKFFCPAIFFYEVFVMYFCPPIIGLSAKHASQYSQLNTSSQSTIIFRNCLRIDRFTQLYVFGRHDLAVDTCMHHVITVTRQPIVCMKISISSRTIPKCCD